MDRLLRWLEKPIDLLLWASLARRRADDAARQRRRRRPLSLQSPIEGTTEVVAAYYMVVVAYLPWAWLARNDRHIVAGFFKRIGTPRFDFWLEIGVKSLTIVYLSVFIYQTFLAGAAPDRAGEVWLAGTKYLPVWPSRWVLPSRAR